MRELLFSVTKKDFVIQTLRVGTVMEVVYAYQWGKRIITFGNLRRGYWIRYHVWEHYGTLEDALNKIQEDDE